MPRLFFIYICALGMYNKYKGVILLKKYVWYEDLDGIIYCPSCQKQIDNLYEECPESDEAPDGYRPIEHPEFCIYCGQHLDWTASVWYGTKEEH